VIPTEQARSCLHEDGTEGTEGTYALRIQGTDLRDWGISITQDYFQADHDAGHWDGVSFWVRRGSAEVGRTMFAGVMDWHTKEVAWNPEAVADPPYNFFCGDIASRPDLKCDRFGVGVGLDEGWRFVAIPFSSMRQQGYGPAALCLYTQGLKGLSFTLAAGNWDFWIDDIAFYRAPPQERPPPVECDDAAPLSAP
jgi:hypothetical protein